MYTKYFKIKPTLLFDTIFNYLRFEVHHLGVVDTLISGLDCNTSHETHRRLLNSIKA